MTPPQDVGLGLLARAQDALALPAPAPAARDSWVLPLAPAHAAAPGAPPAFHGY